MMAYLGNTKGPRESEILDRLDPKHLGCSAAALEEDIAHHIFAEQRGEVVPVHVDPQGRPYIVLSSANLLPTQHLYLEEHGYHLSGHIKTFTTEEEFYWWQRHVMDRMS